MTEEQIKQNAEEYADKLYEDGRCTESTAPTIQEIYTAGAHSRDEEVEMLQNQIEELSEQLKMNAENIQKLRNPWISVKDRLPELIDGWSGSMLVLEDGIWPRIAQYCDNKYHKGWMGHNVGEYSDITHWMPIPKLKGE